ncbi:MAG: Hpt domain-containing protein [Rhodospirillaceae bacterium]|nr:Hpt domain-containing protein [Rhodospirillaceae bacterium]
MKVTGANIDELTQKAELEFHDEATTRFADMNRLLDQIAESGAEDTYVSALLGHAHNLRITGNSFGFPIISLIAQRLESYLNDMSQWSEKTQRDVQEFNDAIGEMLERKSQPDEDEIVRVARPPLPCQPHFLAGRCRGAQCRNPAGDAGPVHRQDPLEADHGLRLPRQFGP